MVLAELAAEVIRIVETHRLADGSDAQPAVAEQIGGALHAHARQVLERRDAQHALEDTVEVLRGETGTSGQIIEREWLSDTAFNLLQHTGNQRIGRTVMEQIEFGVVTEELSHDQLRPVRQHRRLLGCGRPFIFARRSTKILIEWTIAFDFLKTGRHQQLENILAAGKSRFNVR